MSGENYQTTPFGAPVPDNQNSLTAGPDGPILLQDYFLIEKMANFNRERIPERVVHAKGAGAFGYFEVTHDLSDWTRAAFLNKVGKVTQTLVRFSTVGGEKGSADSVRDPRGFAVKFYTEEGNYDLVMNNTPVFFIRDPMKFSDFIRTQKRNPATNCKDPDALWDFASLSPETVHQYTILFSDRGTPKTHRNMHGYSGHTFKWVNRHGQGCWVKYHFVTESGIANWTRQESVQLAGEDPDYATRDLFETIARGEEVAWQVAVQIMPLEEAQTYRFDPFDLTKVWRHSDYPLQPLGRLVLNRNPQNYFAQIEQAAFSPANVVPGVEFSPDKMLQGRLFSYGDAHRYRLGVNYPELPVNQPTLTEVHSYDRDGAMRYGDNGGDSVNYEPNSRGGPRQAPQFREQPFEVHGLAEKTPYRRPDNYTQAGDLYRLLTPEARDRLVDNLVDHMRQARSEVQQRQVVHFYRADPDYGLRVASGLKVDTERLVAQATGNYQDQLA